MSGGRRRAGRSAGTQKRCNKLVADGRGQTGAVRLLRRSFGKASTAETRAPGAAPLQRQPTRPQPNGTRRTWRLHHPDLVRPGGIAVPPAVRQSLHHDAGLFRARPKEGARHGPTVSCARACRPQARSRCASGARASGPRVQPPVGHSCRPWPLRHQPLPVRARRPHLPAPRRRARTTEALAAQSACVSVQRRRAPRPAITYLDLSPASTREPAQHGRSGGLLRALRRPGARCLVRACAAACRAAVRAFGGQQSSGVPALTRGPVCVQCPPQRGRVGRRRSPAARHPQRHALCASHGASHPPLFPSPTRRSGGACGHLPFLHFESSRSAPHHAAPHYAARHRARQRTHAHTARLRVPCSHSTARAATPTAAPRRPPTPRYSQKLRRRCACWTSMTRTRRPRCTSRYCTVRPFLCFGVSASRRRRNPSCCAALRCTAARHGACIHSMSRHRLLALSSRSDVRVPRGRVRVSTGHTEAARLLLEHGASATLPCEGSPPLHLVASCAALPSCAEQAVPLMALLSAHRASAYALCAPT